MKLTTLLLIAGILQVSAATYAQKITLTAKEAPLKVVFDKISDQTGYDFLISTDNLKLSRRVTVTLTNEALAQALEKIFKNQPLKFVIQERMVVVTRQQQPQVAPGATAPFNRPIPVIGKVSDTTGIGLPGATVRIKGTSNATMTEQNGEFKLDAEPGQELEVSFIGYETMIVRISREEMPIRIVLKPATSKLNEIQVIGYGTTTKRLSTGSVASVSAKEIENQPVGNVLSALSGRAPGVLVQTTNGLPGGNVSIQIRGKGSLTAGTNPLYIVDGVPFESTTFGINQFATSSVNGVVSPLNSLNPADIETISILKDADATSIYGSRGSNGVVLITTKKGKAGQSKLSVNLSKGVSFATSQPQLLGSADYLTIRREAFANDRLTPTVTNAPDLLVWKPEQDMNWAEYLFGNKASYTDVQTSLAGGSEATTFLASANMHQEGNIISDQANYLRGGFHFNISHRSADRRFELQVSNALMLDRNTSPNLQSAHQSVLLAPNMPLTDANGTPTLWSGNPAMDLNSTTKVQTNNVITSLSLSYAILKDLKVKLSGGYNRIAINQQRLFPLASVFSAPNYAQFLSNANQSVTVEPQLNYIKTLGKGVLNVLAGGTYQDRNTTGQFFQTSNFSNEELMENFSSAATVDVRSNLYNHYKYVSLFGRVNYSLRDKYIINATFRRDGSSRFGPGNQFGNFGSVGVAWIFSDESWFKNEASFISYGKLRSSFGSTGNDQIADYQYLSTYTSSGRSIQGVSLLAPSRIDNADFHWETTKKLEFGIDLGLLNNQILLGIDYYRNRSDDQLVNYTLPLTTGFSSYQANLPAVIQNSGWEFDLTTTNIKGKSWNWVTSFNLTLPRNKLISFQNFEASTYAQTFQIGYDVTRVKGNQFLGVDPQTGSAVYGDINGASATTTATRNTNYTIGKTTPDLYGGLSNTLSYRNFTLDVFFQFARQMSKGGIQSSIGRLSNMYAYALDRWQQPGDMTNVPKASTISDVNYVNSSANFFNTSYIRLKNIALNYRLSEGSSKALGAQQVNLFIKGENLLTFWNRNLPLTDPEAGGLTGTQPVISPVVSFVAGLSFTF